MAATRGARPITRRRTGAGHLVVLLSVTTIAAAWSGFEASKSGGAMSIAFSQASAARVEATSFQTIVNRKRPSRPR